MKKQLMLGFVLLSGFTAGTIEGYSTPMKQGIMMKREVKESISGGGATKSVNPPATLLESLNFLLNVTLKSVFLTEKEKSAFLKKLKTLTIHQLAKAEGRKSQSYKNK